MNDNDPENEWNKLVRSAKDIGAADGDEAGGREAPSGFVSRVVKLREDLWLMAKTLVWRRWLLVAAGAAFVVLIVVFVFLKLNPPDDAPPAIPLPPAP